MLILNRNNYILRERALKQRLSDGRQILTLSGDILFQIEGKENIYIENTIALDPYTYGYGIESSYENNKKIYIIYLVNGSYIWVFAEEYTNFYKCLEKAQELQKECHIVKTDIHTKVLKHIKF